MFGGKVYETDVNAPTNSNNLIARLQQLRLEWTGSEDEFDRRLKRYNLACCRAIWELLPQDESRNGVEVAERELDGLASYRELQDAEYHAEGAAFNIDYNCEPESIERWVEMVRAMPRESLLELVPGIGAHDDVEPRELLLRAAYFADHAIVYPHLTLKELPDEYVIFLSPKLLDEFFPHTRG